MIMREGRIIKANDIRICVLAHIVYDILGICKLFWRVHIEEPQRNMRAKELVFPSATCHRLIDNVSGHASDQAGLARTRTL